ncbi:MAG: hypothetical protein JNM76_01185 [Betaproteobacteria bacterium]|nr:hypothetical protein [Betaproteobacteria bacterium]
MKHMQPITREDLEGFKYPLVVLQKLMEFRLEQLRVHIAEAQNRREKIVEQIDALEQRLQDARESTNGHQAAAFDPAQHRWMILYSSNLHSSCRVLYAKRADVGTELEKLRSAALSFFHKRESLTTSRSAQEAIHAKGTRLRRLAEQDQSWTIRQDWESRQSGEMHDH